MIVPQPYFHHEMLMCSTARPYLKRFGHQGGNSTSWAFQVRTHRSRADGPRWTSQTPSGIGQVHDKFMNLLFDLPLNISESIHSVEIFSIGFLSPCLPKCLASSFYHFLPIVFQRKEDDGELLIRAVQGHSIKATTARPLKASISDLSMEERDAKRYQAPRSVLTWNQDNLPRKKSMKL